MQHLFSKKKFLPIRAARRKIDGERLAARRYQLRKSCGQSGTTAAEGIFALGARPLRGFASRRELPFVRRGGILRNTKSNARSTRFSTPAETRPVAIPLPAKLRRLPTAAGYPPASFLNAPPKALKRETPRAAYGKAKAVRRAALGARPSAAEWRGRPRISRSLPTRKISGERERKIAQNFKNPRMPGGRTRRKRLFIARPFICDRLFNIYFQKFPRLKFPRAHARGALPRSKKRKFTCKPAE